MRAAPGHDQRTAPVIYLLWAFAIFGGLCFAGICGLALITFAARRSLDAVDTE